MRALLIWSAVAAAIFVPMGLAALSPLLAWRSGLYIFAGFAGIFAMGLLVVQPLAMGGYLPGLRPRVARRVHRLVGVLVLMAVLAHVAGLWLTSPPDVVDALLFVSPTPFSVWGVLAMWALVLTAVLGVLRQRGRLSWKRWRWVHLGTALVIVGGTVAHAVLIVGTMEVISKYALALGLVLVSAKVLMDQIRR